MRACVTTRVATDSDLPFLDAEGAQHLYRRLGYVDSGALLLPDEAAELIFRKPLAT